MRKGLNRSGPAGLVSTAELACHVARGGSLGQSLNILNQAGAVSMPQTVAVGDLVHLRDFSPADADMGHQRRLTLAAACLLPPSPDILSNSP
jgi:hypothetical protein